MIIYSLTFSLEEQLLSEWKLWLDQELFAYLKYHKLSKHELLKVHAEHSPNTVSYNLQFKAASMSLLQLFMVEHEAKLLEIIHKKFKDKCLVFSAILEQVSFS